MRFSVQLRVIDDRPDPNGWQSSGRDLPTFVVDAVHHDNALGIVANIVREFGNYTRVNAHVCDVDARADVVSRMFYAPGWDAERCENGIHRVRWQYAENGYVIDGNPYAEDDADSATLFYADGTCAVSVIRAPRGGWAIESSDNGHNIVTSWYRKRFQSPGEAAGFLAAKWGIAFTEVESWDDSEDVA